MKKIFLISVILAVFSLIFSACSDDGAEYIIKDLKLESYETTLEVGAKGQIKVVSGNGDYQAEISNDNVKAEFKEETLYIEALKGGEANIKITDAEKQETTIKVTVFSPKNLELSVSELTLESGEKSTVKVLGGNGDYKLEVSNENIKAELKDGEIIVDAVKEGTSVIKITDAKEKEALVKVEVLASKGIKTSALELNLTEGDKEVVKILEGNGEYKVTSSNSNIKVELKNDEILVSALKQGKSVINVVDAKGKKVAIQIEVFASKSIKLDVDKLIIKKGTQETIKILEGNGDYKVTVSNNNIKTVLKDNVISVDALNEGDSTIKITDAKGKTVSVKVEISLTKVLKLSSTKLLLEKGTKESIKILDGNGDYKVTPSNGNIKVELVGGIIYINAINEGTATVKVIDAQGKSLIVNVEVSLTKILKLDTSEITFEKGTEKQIKILDGNGNYKVSTSNNNVNAQINNNVIIVKAISGGASTIKVTDAKGKEVSVKVTVTEPKELKLSTSELTIEEGAKGQVKILDGNGGYKVSASNNSVSVQFDNNIITATAVSSGTVVITVIDVKGEKATVNINIPSPKELKLSTSELTIEEGAKGEVKILDGNGDYTVLASNNNVSVQFSGDVITVTAVSGGTSVIKVTDAKGKEVSVKVTIPLPKDLKLSASELTLEQGTTGEVNILEGNGGYSVETSNNNINAQVNNNVISIEAVSEGAATIKVTDGKGKETFINVVISSLKTLKLSESEVKLEQGTKGTINILEGNGGYSVATSNNNVNAQVNNNVISIEALSEGTTTITVTDAKNQQSTITVQVTAAQASSNDLMSRVHRIKVVFQQGHFHGTSFHGNPENQTPLKANYYTILEKDANGNWVAVEKSGDQHYINEGEPFVFESVSFAGPGGTFKKDYSPGQAYEYIFYDKDGNRLDNEFSENSNVYQMLFSVEKYNELDADFKPKNEVQLSSMKDFMTYVHRDTNPADKMKAAGVSLANNYLGLKGYGWVMKNRISYNLKIKFVKYKDQNSKVNSIYLEDANTSKIEKAISFEVPIIIPTERDDYDARIGGFAKYYNMSYDEFEELFWDSAPTESSQYWM